ncbi:oligosaccharide flippase family protein [Pseudoalteromonas marina]|uniref:oligosaccharide flippase family protein n=1 Tax=Pseudoalteromonas marina TaxID=267375 RepID=UPI002736010C|nr:oligosaccharide flippase family protein [Pseudoalteromonas marina]MDP2485779.1 oligosaccharide flippase family protein [Pseudoalteromonas marina]
MSNSFKTIMKTTGVVGAVQVIKLLFGLIRNKLIAFYFGPAGLGMWGLYLSFTEMVQGLACLGLEKSSVKQIAENHQDEFKKHLTIKVAQLSLITFSVICSVTVAIFAAELSIVIFGNIEYQIGVLICSGVILFNCLSASYRSILNGLNEIKALAISQLIGILIGNIIVFLLIPFLEISAIPYYFLIVAICAFIPTFIFVKKLKIPSPALTFAEGFEQFSMLMKVGFAFWISAIFMTFITFMVNIFLKDNLNLEVVGIYQASWTISNLYIGIILSSMGIAFFPKICQVVQDKQQANTLINEQIEFGLLVSLPFVVGIFIFAPILLMILYSSEFSAGEWIIRWQMLGVIIRLLGFPFGYALMAKGKAIQYTIAQFLFSSLNYGLIIWFVNNYGFEGLGINYFVAYVIYTIIVGLLNYRFLNYKPSIYLIKIFAFYLVVICISMMLFFIFDGVLLYIFGVLVVIVSMCFSYYQLSTKLNINVVSYIKSKLKK